MTNAIDLVRASHPAPSLLTDAVSGGIQVPVCRVHMGSAEGRGLTITGHGASVAMVSPVQEQGGRPFILTEAPFKGRN